MRSIFALIITLPLLLLSAEWQALNGPPAGRADDMCMGWDPLHYYWVIYAADQTHKLYKSTDEGEHWDSIATHSEVVKPLCVVCEQNNAQVVYIGRNYSTPVYKSENGGINWVEKSNGITNTLPRCFGLDPQSSNRIYLGCGASAGNYSLFFSSNGGTNWYGRGNINVSVNDILVVHEPAQAESVFLATSAGIYLSTDAGMNWYLRQTGNFCSIDNYIDDTGVRIFYATQNMYTGGVYRSEDGAGANWSPLENSPHNPVDIAIQRGSPHYIYCATEYYCVYRSTDNGSSWTQINYHFCDPIVRCLLIHPGNENIIYAGTAECLYKSSDAGNTWIEKTNGFKLTDKACDLSLALPVAIFVSYEGHETWKLESNKWTLRFTYPPWTFVSSHPFGAANGDVLVNDVVPSLVYVTSEVCGIDGDYICRSTDGGWTWQRRDTTHMLLNRKSLAMNPIYDNIIYIVGESPPQFLRSTDYGLTWELHTIYHNSELPNFFSIDLSNSEPQAIYLGDVTYGIAKSMNDGNDWDFYSSGLPGAKISAVAVDPDIPSIIYAGTAGGVYKSTDYGQTWHDLGLVQYPYITDIEIDPEEPTIVYAVCKENESVMRSYVISSVDRGRVGFYAGWGLPDTTYDIEIDRHYPEAVYCTTNRGVYTYIPDFNKHLVSGSIEATFANNGRKLLHIYATNELWACYESGGVIYAVHSTDDGATWSRKQEIGEGYTPALAIRDVPDYPPYIVWRADGATRDTIYFAGYISGNKWSDPFPLVVSRPDIDFGPPSFVIGDYNIGHLAYSDGSNSYYVSFSVYNPGNPVTELIGQGINPFIGFMPTQEYPQVHCVLEDDGVIYYSARGENGWTEYYEVSRDEGNNITITDCHHPSLVIEGDVVYVVWDGVFDNNRNIFWRHLTYFAGGAEWSWIWPVCNTQNPSGYPILTTGFFCSWVERQGNDYEIYYARYEPPVWGWRGQTNLSNSPDKISRFSHLAHKQTEQGTDIYFIWTENSAPPYDIKFERVTIGGGGGSGPDALAGLPLYIAKGGEEEKSPFNTRRGGYIHYGNLPYQRVDIDSQYIGYRFENLDYKRDYDLVFCVYQHGYSNLPLFLKVDGVQVGVVNIPQDTLIIRRHRIPASIYADSVMWIKVYGNPAISGMFVLYEYERIRSKGGPQDKGTVGIGSRKSTFEVYPNPFNNNLTIKFQTPGLKSQNPNGNVGQGFSLAVYDVTGRMVRDFSRLTVNGERSTVFWDGCDDSGRNLPAGVYFVRLDVDDFKKVEKVIFLR